MESAQYTPKRDHSDMYLRKMSSNLRCERCINTNIPPLCSSLPSPSSSFYLSFFSLLLLLLPLPSFYLSPFSFSLFSISPFLLLQNRRLSSKKRKKLEDQQQGSGSSGKEGGSSEGSSSPMDSPAVTSTTHTPPAQEKR